MNFPVLTLSTRKNIAVFTKESELTTCTKLGLNNGHFNGLKIIDKEGWKYEVKYAEKTSTIGLFWGYNVFGDQKLRVRLVLGEDIRKIELKEFQEIVVKAIASDRYFWSSGGRVSDLIASIRQAETYEKVFFLLK